MPSGSRGRQPLGLRELTAPKGIDGASSSRAEGLLGAEDLPGSGDPRAVMSNKGVKLTRVDVRADRSSTAAQLMPEALCPSTCDTSMPVHPLMTIPACVFADTDG